MSRHLCAGRLHVHLYRSNLSSWRITPRRPGPYLNALGWRHALTIKAGHFGAFLTVVPR